MFVFVNRKYTVRPLASSGCGKEGFKVAKNFLSMNFPTKQLEKRML